MAIPKGPPILIPFQGAVPWPAVERFATRKGLGDAALSLLTDVIARLDVHRAKRETDELKRRTPR